MLSFYISSFSNFSILKSILNIPDKNLGLLKTTIFKKTTSLKYYHRITHQQIYIKNVTAITRAVLKEQLSISITPNAKAPATAATKQPLFLPISIPPSLYNHYIIFPAKLLTLKVHIGVIILI